MATTVGSFLVIVIDPLDVHLPNGSSDLIGIAFAMGSSILFAVNVVFTRHLTIRGFSPPTMFFQRAMAMAVTYSVLSSLAGEAWKPFAHLTVSSWVIYVILLAALTSGGLSQVLSISRVKATLFSTLLSWRLLVVLAVGWALLGEWLASIWQGVGVVIVILSITLYLRHQATHNQSRSIPIVKTTDQEENS
jgi:drug/metabolite transporter (DMT)-like permease